MQITMSESQVDVQPLPGGEGKVIIVADKSGNTIVIPLSTEAAKAIGAKLSTGLLVATGPMKSNGGVH